MSRFLFACFSTVFVPFRFFHSSLTFTVMECLRSAQGHREVFRQATYRLLFNLHNVDTQQTRENGTKRMTVNMEVQKESVCFSRSSWVTTLLLHDSHQFHYLRFFLPISAAVRSDRRKLPSMVTFCWCSSQSVDVNTFEVSIST